MKLFDSRFGSFYSASFLLSISNLLTLGLQFVFQIVMAHVMAKSPHPGNFSLMNALFSLSSILSLPVALFMTRRWAELANTSRQEETGPLWYALAVVAALTCLSLIAVAILFIRPIAWFLKTDDYAVIIAVMFGAGLATVCGLATHFLVARQWFVALALGSIGGALLRILLGGTGALYDAPLWGAIIGTALSSSIAAGVVFFRLPWPGFRNLPFKKLAPEKKDWSGPLFAAIAMCCISVDISFVRHYFPSEQADLLVKVIILGRVIVYLLAPISMVVFPKIATTENEASALTSPIVRRAFLLGICLLLLAASSLTFLAPFGMKLMKASASAEAVYYLRMAFWCFIPLSLCQLMIPSLITRRQNRHLLEFALLSMCLPIGFVFFHERFSHILLVEAVVGSILLIFLIIRGKDLALGFARS